MATDNTALGRDVVPGAVPAVHVSQLVKRYGDICLLYTSPSPRDA